MRRIIGGLLIILSIAILGFVLYQNSQYSSTTRVFSPYTLLSSSWENYKVKFINSDGRVIDPSRNNLTTSEGQSYALLRAVWMDDKPTFDKVWNWTKNNLKRPNDNLFGWEWGQRQDGSYGFIENGGDNSATDADSDICLALIFASHRWGDPSYENSAKGIISDLWNLDTDVALGKRYLIAGNWAKSSHQMIINPSYFAPYEWRIFAGVDTSHNWTSLIDPAYAVLNQSTQSNLDTDSSAKLPPDWFALNKQTGQIQATGIPSLKTNYSYDAMRIPWRIYLDYKWFNEPRAKQYLESSFGILYMDYEKQGKLVSTYSHDGKPLASNEDPAMYATSLGYFLVVHPDIAGSIYQNKIVRLYSNSTNSFNQDLPYYQQNWLWFGAGIYNDLLPNLAK